MMKAFFVVCFALITLPSLGQLKPYSYSVNTGLNDQRFYALSKDQYGRLILATSNGVFSYNGFKSKALDVSELKSNEFTSIVKVGKAVYGLNKAKQLVEIGLLKSTVLNIPGNSEDIRWIKSLGSKLIVCTNSRIYRFSTGPFALDVAFEVPFLTEKKSILDYTEYANESYVLLSSNELVAIHNKSSWDIPEKNTRFLVASKAGITLVPAYINRQNSFRFKQARFTNLHVISSLVSKKIDRLIQFGSRIFLCSEGSLLVYDVSTRKTVMHLTGFAAQDVLQEENGTIWLATLRKGLVCIPKGDYNLASQQELYSLARISGMSGFLGATATGDVVEYDGAGKSLGTLAVITSADYASFQVLNENYLSFGNFIISKAGKLQISYVGESVKGFVELPDGLLVAGAFGLRKYTTKNLAEIGKRHTKYQRLLTEPIKGLVQLDSKAFLIHTSGDIIHYSLETGKKVSVKYYNQDLDVLQLVAYNGKAILLTASNQVLVYNNDHITHERDLKDVNPDIKIQRIKVVGEQVYLLSDNTLYRYKGINGEIERLDQLSTMNGLYLRDFVVVQSHVYVATQFGIYKFKWHKQERQLPTFIVGMPLGNYPVDTSKTNIKFTYENSWVKLPFEVVELGESHPFILQYRLIRNSDESDSTWVNSSTLLNELSFEHLEGGNYTLELRLKDPYSSNYSKIHRRYFKVNYFWLEYKWIWVLFGVISTLLVSAFIRNRELKLRALKNTSANNKS